MQTAKITTNDHLQTVNLPEGCQVNGDEVYVHKYGQALLLVPRDKSWEVFLEGLEGFSEDFMKQGRDQGINEV